MTISRRGFLQALLSIPAIAAIPKLVEAVEALPVVDVKPGVWLLFDGVPVECISVSMSSRDEVIEIDKTDWDDPHPLRTYRNGLRHHNMQAEIVGLEFYDQFYSGDSISIEARFPPCTITATAFLVSVAHSLGVGTMPSTRVEMRLKDVAVR